MLVNSGFIVCRCEVHGHSSHSSLSKANHLVKELPGGYKIGQVVRYSKWESSHRMDASSDGSLTPQHTGKIVGFDIRHEQFYYMVDCRGRLEEVKPGDIET